MEHDTCDTVCAEVDIEDDGTYRTSRSVQVCPEAPTVLITATKDQLMERIKSFVQFKRKQIDLSNQLEFTYHPTSDESTCARVNTAFVGGARHIATCVTNNVEGPNGHLPTLREQLWAELVLEGRELSRPEITSEHVLMLNERLQELEDILDCKDTSHMSLHQRVRNLETRVLHLEGTSIEYKSYVARTT